MPHIQWSIGNAVEKQMNDIRLTWNDQAGAADFSVEENDLASDDGLENSVLLSLFLDRRAEEGDVLPSGETDRRGWWGDTLPTVDGDQIGSRLWLLARAKDSPATLARASEYISESLEWMKEDRVADTIEVSVTSRALASGRSIMLITIQIHRPKVDPVTFRFDYNWSSQEARRA